MAEEVRLAAGMCLGELGPLDLDIVAFAQPRQEKATSGMPVRVLCARLGCS